MNREEALRNLRSDSQLQRFQAARSLISEAHAEDIGDLLSAKRSEADALVITWLDQAILSCRARQAVSAGDVEIPSFDPVAYRKAVEWVTGVLIHEIGSRFGLAQYAASEAIADYAGSETAARMADLGVTLDAIEDLQAATKATSQEEFDLAAFVDQTIDDEQFDESVEVLAVGPRPNLIYGIPRLLKLALRNGLRNAVDASKQAAISQENGLRDKSPPVSNVVVTWGMTDTECFVSIIDSGVGLPKSKESLFELGATTKRGHSGFGLAIAKQAMETMDGTVELGPSNGGGAKFLIAWQRPL
ncbi:ATP-binding protein [Burkholderia gladioli]|uniref:sensor histidine kinase n=1 Tax=Burkholderia gladioli TaxID=28095 RepID=UPI0026570FFD|nr:ATP-binding protein [Burkholderia gladioli]MDN7603914.1 ATP-binding protein [Burkholderia gladioli]